jgi:hypothetical protein
MPANKNDRVELAMKIAKYRSLSKRATNNQAAQRLDGLVAELERKLREIDE